MDYESHMVVGAHTLKNFSTNEKGIRFDLVFPLIESSFMNHIILTVAPPAPNLRTDEKAAVFGPVHKTNSAKSHIGNFLNIW